MHKDEVWAVIDRERAALADIEESLTPEQWAAPSLCAGWTVRDVAAHVTFSGHAGLGAVVTGMVRARGRYNTMIYAQAKQGAARPTEEIVADLRSLVGSRRRPPGTAYLDPLIDVLVHTQDIAIPLGVRHAMPIEAARAAVDFVWLRSMPFFPKKRLAGVHLSATDTEWGAGRGVSVEGPLEALLLLSTGRPAALERLSGPGVPKVAAALRTRV